MKRIWNPKLKSISTDDGRATLTFSGFDTSRDGGGKLLTFELTRPSFVEKMLICKILVADHTVDRARTYYQKQNIDYWKLSLTEKSSLNIEYGNKFGKYYDVKEFHPQNFKISQLPDAQVEEIRDLICALYLKRYATYSFNNPDPSADPDGFYPDEISFQPIGEANQFKKRFLAQEVLGS